MPPRRPVTYGAHDPSRGSARLVPFPQRQPTARLGIHQPRARGKLCGTHHRLSVAVGPVAHRPHRQPLDRGPLAVQQRHQGPSHAQLRHRQPVRPLRHLPLPRRHLVLLDATWRRSRFLGPPAGGLLLPPYHHPPPAVRTGRTLPHGRLRQVSAAAGQRRFFPPACPHAV
ncbi:MAG: hypothetical protein HY689_12510 [Chloroflexi bacterium]|nr:hypothetical protein [Chloroflexota bacterium]